MKKPIMDYVCLNAGVVNFLKNNINSLIKKK